MDKFRIDSHKLIYHVDRVSDWLHGETIYPIYIEASPSGACNHRCTFCGLDFMEYKPNFLDADLFSERLTEMASLGLKSIMYGGEGEPFLNKHTADFITHGKSRGLDNAVTTNGVLMKPEISERILGSTEWIKISINAGTRETYSQIHRTKADDFDTVLANLAAATDLRKAEGYTCTLGMQMILLPENRHEAPILAEKASDAGADYLVIKPYSQHPLSKTTQYADVQYASDDELADKLAEFASESFAVIFRRRTMQKWDERAKGYERCLGLPFWAYIDSVGNVWGCSCHLGSERFLYGNLYERTFQEIWQSDKRKKSLEWVERDMDASECRINCRMDEVNRYLWELKHPPAHVNFI